MSIDDIDAVTTTIVSAFDPGPIWTYLYQFRDRYPRYHWRCFRKQVEQQYLRQTMDYQRVLVPSEEGNTSARSCAMWKNRGSKRDAESKQSQTMTSMLALEWGIPEDLLTGRAGHGAGHIELSRQGMTGDRQAHVKAGQQEDNELELPCSLHLDMSLIRALHLVPQFEAAEKTYIEDAYEYQLYLGLLATHPDWDGHGFGAAQVRWGMEKAKAEERRLSLAEGREIKVPVTLLATARIITLML